jgi:hypothetical protein
MSLAGWSGWGTPRRRRTLSATSRKPPSGPSTTTSWKPKSSGHPNYYAAFVCDPDGNNVEVVCHDPKG